jgi:hypothetical protein
VVSLLRDRCAQYAPAYIHAFAQAIGGVIDKAATAGMNEYDDFKRSTPPGSRPGGSSTSYNNNGYPNEKATYTPPGAAPPGYTAGGPGQPQDQNQGDYSTQAGYDQGERRPSTSGQKPQKKFWLRVITAAEVIGTSIEATTANLIESTTTAASTAAE